MAKRTPLYASHVNLGAKIVEFGGWDMPVYYSGIKQEHLSTRNNAGLFDIGHMGAIKVSGKSALPFLQKVISNDASKLKSGDSQYSIILNDAGGVIDDIFVYRINDFYLLVVNASNTEKDIAWLKKNLIPWAEMHDLKENMTLLAFQGPKAQDILQEISSANLSSIGHHKVISGKIKGVESLISRSGYTGEDGFELFFDKGSAELIWDSILHAGKNKQVLPCGLGARDTLRLEASLPLYGHEYDDKTTPLEAGFSFAVRFDKEDFIGKNTLLQQKQEGVKKKLIGLKMRENMIARQGYSVHSGETLIGAVTSGTLSPTLGYPIAMAYVKTEFSGIGQMLDVEIRGKRCPAEVVKLPFYKR